MVFLVAGESLGMFFYNIVICMCTHRERNAHISDFLQPRLTFYLSLTRLWWWLTTERRCVCLLQSKLPDQNEKNTSIKLPQKKPCLECSWHFIIQDKTAGIVIVLALKYCIWIKNTSYSFAHRVQMTPVSLQAGQKHFSLHLFQLHASVHTNTNFIRSLDLVTRVHLEASTGRNLFSDRNVTVAAHTDRCCLWSLHCTNTNLSPPCKQRASRTTL